MKIRMKLGQDAIDRYGRRLRKVRMRSGRFRVRLNFSFAPFPLAHFLYSASWHAFSERIKWTELVIVHGSLSLLLCCTLDTQLTIACDQARRVNTMKFRKAYVLMAALT